MKKTYKPERRFEAFLTVHELWGYKNVVMHLFKKDSENNTDTIDFARAIKGDVLKDKYRIYPELYLRELFTWEEVKVMRGYFKEKDVHTFHHSEVKFPIGKDTIGVSAIPVGGNSDCYMYSKAKNYSLKFSVYGYYSITGCKKI